ncbi:MAG TPA: hypothetical protein VGA92_07270 [Candidatus Nitrosotenuis sp.]|jgi:hypothetical protein
MKAPTSFARYAESDSKGADITSMISGAVNRKQDQYAATASMIVCEVWARFTHIRGDICEAICGVFATDVGTQSDYQIANPNSRCVEVEKGGNY